METGEGAWSKLRGWLISAPNIRHWKEASWQESQEAETGESAREWSAECNSLEKVLGSNFLATVPGSGARRSYLELLLSLLVSLRDPRKVPESSFLAIARGSGDR